MFKFIVAMAESQSRIYDKLVDASDQINLHLAKLVLFSDSEYVPHWKKEIFAFLHRVDRLKGSKKWPKEKMIMRALSTHDDTAEQYMMLAMDDESELAVSGIITVSDIERAFFSYHAWLAKELSINGMITRSSAYEELNNICRLSETISQQPDSFE